MLALRIATWKRKRKFMGFRAGGTERNPGRQAGRQAEDHFPRHKAVTRPTGKKGKLVFHSGP